MPPIRPSNEMLHNHSDEEQKLAEAHRVTHEELPRHAELIDRANRLRKALTAYSHKTKEPAQILAPPHEDGRSIVYFLNNLSRRDDYEASQLCMRIHSVDTKNPWERTRVEYPLASIGVRVRFYIDLDGKKVDVGPLNALGVQAGPLSKHPELDAQVDRSAISCNEPLFKNIEDTITFMEEEATKLGMLDPGIVTDPTGHTGSQPAS